MQLDSLLDSLSLDNPPTVVDPSEVDPLIVDPSEVDPLRVDPLQARYPDTRGDLRWSLVEDLLIFWDSVQLN